MLNASSKPGHGVPSVSGAQLTPVPTTPRKLPWGPFAAIVVTLVGYLLSNFGVGILIALIIGLVLPFCGISSEQFGGFIGGTLQQFIFVLAIEVAALGILWWFLHRRKAKPADIGLGRLPRWSDLGWGVLVFLCYFGAFIVVSSLASFIGVDTEQKQELGIDTYTQSGLGLVLVFLTLVVLPPIAEEIIFRGFLFSGLRQSWRPGIAAVVTSLIFGALHLFGGVSGEGLLWIAAIDTFVLSLFLCYVRYKTDSLWGSIVVHALKNSMAFAVLFIFHAA